jgi:alpha,alpha-trehalase
MDHWHLVYEGYDPAQEGLREALCTLGNGYFATRGATPDSAADEVHYPGTYLAGGYNRLTTTLAGREVENEDLVNLPNWLPLTFRIDDGPWYRVDDGEVLAYRQELDLGAGVLRRDVRVRDAAGRTTRWPERRLVSMAECHVAALHLELTAEDWSGRLTVRTARRGGDEQRCASLPRARQPASRDARTPAVGRRRDLSPDPHHPIAHSDRRGRPHPPLSTRTRNRRRATDRRAAGSDRAGACDDGRGGRHDFRGEDRRLPHVARPGELGARSRSRRTLAHGGRFDDVLRAHALAWTHLWDECDIALDDHATAETELKLRVYVFHVLQTISPHTVERDVGVPARGWHGEAYRGHIFWDEIFVFPFLNLRLPTLTRALLRYRYRRLTEARRAALEAGYRGAMFPWQSGSNGREESQRVHLNPRSGRWVIDNTFRQRHINAGIAYNVWQYHQATDDHEFLYAYGAEMLLEIARFWASIAAYNAEIDRYEIKGVMGPDEYHTAYPGTDPAHEGGIDNNAYTNVMAAWVLSRACDVLDLLPKAQCRKLCERIGLDAAEIEAWQVISRKLRVPFHGDGIISQFEGYDQLVEFDWQAYRTKYGDIHRLDRILEAEGDSTNRYRLSKQADVLMLFYLFSADELRLLFEQLGYPFDQEMISRNVAYYLARTSHGSTLSRVAHSWVLARSDRARSWRLFQGALDSDIADTQGGTTPEGIHVGAMAGTIDLVQRCYLGIEMRGYVLHFDPALPSALGRVRARLRYHRQTLDIEATHDELRIGSRPQLAAPITIGYRGRFREVAPGDTYAFRLLRPQDRDRDETRRAGVSSSGAAPRKRPQP